MRRNFWPRFICLIALCAIMPATICPQSNRQSSPRSNGEKVSVNNLKESETQYLVEETKRLTDEANKRRETAECWDTWNIRFVFLAGFAGVLLVIGAIGVSKSNRALLEVSDELEKAKDRENAAVMAAIQGEAAGANERAGEANERAGKANEVAGKANEKAAGLELAVAAQQERAANAERQLEAERSERAKMEGAISPRILSGQNEMASRLKQSFPGIRMKIYSLADTETWRLAGQIGMVAYEASWPVISMGKFFNPDARVLTMSDGTMYPIVFGEGVEVGFVINPDTFPRTNTIAEKAANALAAELQSHNIKARVGRVFEDATVDLVIIVGSMPTDYFDRNKQGGRGNRYYMNVVEYR